MRQHTVTKKSGVLYGWLSLLFLLLIACNTAQAVSQTAGLVPSPTITADIQVVTFEQATPAKIESAPTPTLMPASPTPTPNPLPVIRQLTTGNCCTDLYWNSESTEVRFIDQPSANEPVGVWAVNITQPNATSHLVTERLGQYNQENTLLAYPDPASEFVTVERLEDGQTWQIDTQGSSVSFTPDNRLIWTVDDDEVWWRSQQNEVWLAEADGSDAQRLIALQRASLIAWLSDTELLVSRRLPPTQDVMLSKLSIDDGAMRDLVQLPRIRGVLLSSDKRHLVYMTRFEENMPSGVWLLDLEAASPATEPLPFFGSYRWRDEQRLIYIPFDPEATQHIFYEYDLETQQSRPLFPPGEEPNAGFIIANNDWQVSPDGSKIALLAANGAELDGIWVVEIGQSRRNQD